jgi:hypothetical protein
LPPNEEEMIMSDPKESKQHEQETLKPVQSHQDELSERDLAKAAGGGGVYDDESPKE